MKNLFALMTTLLACAAVTIRAADVDGFTDAQIVAILVTANMVDIDAGKLAFAHANTHEVKEFAERMVTDHTGLNESAKELATRLALIPEANAITQQLRLAAQANLDQLEGLTGVAFDKAYIDHEVTFHQSMIDSINGSLINDARNDALETFLEKVRPVFVSHHEQAKRIAAKLSE